MANKNVNSFFTTGTISLSGSNSLLGIIDGQLRRVNATSLSITPSGLNLNSGTYRINNIPYNTFAITFTHAADTFKSGLNYFGLNDLGYSQTVGGLRRRLPIMETCQIRKASWTHLVGTLGTPSTIYSTGIIINSTSTPPQTGIVNIAIDSSTDTIPNQYTTIFSTPITVTSGDLLTAALNVSGFTTAPLLARDTVILYCYN
jgi:hypothetical protein